MVRVHARFRSRSTRLAAFEAGWLGEPAGCVRGSRSDVATNQLELRAISDASHEPGLSVRRRAHVPVGRVPVRGLRAGTIRRLSGTRGRTLSGAAHRRTAPGPADAHGG